MLNEFGKKHQSSVIEDLNTLTFFEEFNEIDKQNYDTMKVFCNLLFIYDFNSNYLIPWKRFFLLYVNTQVRLLKTTKIYQNYFG